MTFLQARRCLTLGVHLIRETKNNWDAVPIPECGVPAGAAEWRPGYAVEWGPGSASGGPAIPVQTGAEASAYGVPLMNLYVAALDLRDKPSHHALFDRLPSTRILLLYFANIGCFV